MERSIARCVEGFIGASSDKCYRMDLTPEDVKLFNQFDTGQRALMLIDFFYHVSMGMDLDGPTETTVQNVLKMFEDYLLESVD